MGRLVILQRVPSQVNSTGFIAKSQEAEKDRKEDRQRYAAQKRRTYFPPAGQGQKDSIGNQNQCVVRNHLLSSPSRLLLVRISSNRLYHTIDWDLCQYLHKRNHYAERSHNISQGHKITVQLRWVQAMSNIRNAAKEIVFRELILTKSPLLTALTK
ncbi:MAG: TnpV protein [Ruminococcaceae bacterium]|nr:TnpV protein [Oscillospiraceae bacterium]